MNLIVQLRLKPYHLHGAADVCKRVCLSPVFNGYMSPCTISIETVVSRTSRQACNLPPSPVWSILVLVKNTCLDTVSTGFAVSADLSPVMLMCNV